MSSTTIERLSIPRGTWVTCQKAGTIYRGQLTLDYDSIHQQDVQITSESAPLGYYHLMAPVQIFHVGSEDLASEILP